ncbi:MAG: hypothetical protein ABIT71_07875 [Vicinamibacteraceae bacterium]
MRLLRSIGAVIAGYLLFAMPAFAFFQVSGQAPHQEAPLVVMLASMVVGVVAAGLGGYAAAALAGRSPLAHGIAVALVIAAGATASLVSAVGHGTIWSQLAALLLMVPSAAIGGAFRARQRRSLT